MKTASHWFELYGVSHKNKINKLIHWVCIPVILLCTLGLMQSIPHPFGEQSALHFGSLFAAFALLFYFRLSWTLGLGMALVTGTALAINAALVAAGVDLLIFSSVTFFVAWVFQFIGHKIEGKKPSFFNDLQFLLIGPAWLVQFIYKKVGIPVETRRRDAATA